MKKLILKHALHNAVQYKGKANPGAVIGKLIAEDPDLKRRMKDTAKEVQKVVKEVNKMKPGEQLKELQELAPELLEKKEKEEKDIFAFLNIRDYTNVVTCFPPEPSKYPHIGHAKAIFLNYELAQKHKGKFFLRFEDTNPGLAEKEFYDIHEECYKWLGIESEKITHASDYMDEFIHCAEKLIKESQAYVCTCSQKVIKENRFKGKECACRYKTVKEQQELWKKFLKSKEGEMVLRLKGIMDSQNTVMRDPALMRVIEKSHPRTKRKYRVWPTYDFENAVMDGLQKVTHRLRTKEFELRNEVQRMIQTMLGFQQTNIYEFARFNMEGIESSGRVIRDLIKKKKLVGWDDPSLTTLVALKRRGFSPQALKEFLLSTGITKAESTYTWDDIISQNRKVIDKEANRYFFIEKMKKIIVEGAPKQHLSLKLHPEDAERGRRKFEVQDHFNISEKDYGKIKPGQLYRLMDCLNFTKKGNKLIFDSQSVDNYKEKGAGIMHWLPLKDLIHVEIMMPDKKVIKGMGEHTLKNVKEGDVVQFERFGFCKLDKKEKTKLVFWYTHK